MKQYKKLLQVLCTHTLIYMLTASLQNKSPKVNNLLTVAPNSTLATLNV